MKKDRLLFYTSIIFLVLGMLPLVFQTQGSSTIERVFFAASFGFLSYSLGYAVKVGVFKEQDAQPSFWQRKSGSNLESQNQDRSLL